SDLCNQLAPVKLWEPLQIQWMAGSFLLPTTYAVKGVLNRVSTLHFHPLYEILHRNFDFRYPFSHWPKAWHPPHHSPSSTWARQTPPGRRGLLTINTPKT
ncbi:265_t:CDS:2, partial [Acaulospora colombiana]